jgi:cell division protein FtsL
VIAVSAAFVAHLAIRGRSVELGYTLGKARAEQARLREAKRVLSLEVASYETPQRVEMVARTLLGMGPPLPERVILMRPIPASPEEGPDRGDDGTPPAPAASASVVATASAAANTTTTTVDGGAP